MLTNVFNWIIEKVKRLKCSKSKVYNQFSVELLIDTAAYHFVSAELLFNSGMPFTYFSGGYILHLSIELALKALCQYKNHEFKATHILRQLIKQVKPLEFDEDDLTLLNELDMLYNLRYPLNGSNIGQTVKNAEGGSISW